MKTQVFSEELLSKITTEKPKFYIGVDCFDENMCAYCLCKKSSNGVMEILLSKTIKNKKKWKQEVLNLAEYFDATIFGELT